MSHAMHPPGHEADPSFRGYIGVGRRDITPEVGIYCHNWGSARHEQAESIHKPLYATALSFRSEADDRPMIIATLDYCWFRSYGVFESLRQPILEAYGLEPHQFLLILTHSHAVPHIDAELESRPGGDKIRAFRARLIEGLRESIDAAVRDAVPAVLSWGRGDCSLARTRDFLEPESGQILCGPNPDGIADTTLLVGCARAEASGEPLATLVNYACHPVSLGGGNRAVSPDYVGSLRDLVEAHTGGAPCMFLHGPSGNQTPRDSYSADTAVADANGEILGFAALSVLRGLLPAGQRLEFARRESSGAQLAVWETRPYAVNAVARSTSQLLQLPAKDWPSIPEIEAQLQAETDAAARERLTRLKEFIVNFHAGLGAGFPVWAMRLGQAILIGTPAEPFTDLQVELRRRYPRLAIIVTNDTNGSFNYLPPKSYYGNGAYEQDCSDFGPGCLEMVTEAAALLIGALMSESSGT